MTLTTHAITGAALATLIPKYPALAFTFGFISHFILDAIPHWDYPLASMKNDKKQPLNNTMLINKDFLKDLLKIGFDAVLGLCLAYFLFGFSEKYAIFTLLSGAIGGMLPDALQFVYMKWRHEPLVSLQRFHLWIHAKTHLNNKPVVGILSQIILIIIFSTLLSRIL